MTRRCHWRYLINDSLPPPAAHVLQLPATTEYMLLDTPVCIGVTAGGVDTGAAGDEVQNNPTKIFVTNEHRSEYNKVCRMSQKKPVLFCSLPSLIRGSATPWTYFLHLSLSSVILGLSQQSFAILASKLFIHLLSSVAFHFRGPVRPSPRK